MATHQRQLVKVFDKTIGIEPGITTSILLHASADDGILHVTVGVIPTITDEQIVTLLAALRDYSMAEASKAPCTAT